MDIGDTILIIYADGKTSKAIYVEEGNFYHHCYLLKQQYITLIKNDHTRVIRRKRIVLIEKTIKDFNL